jgi:hypothetical protein
MQFNFFALFPDKISLLEYIFSDTGFRIFDHYSTYGQELKEYKSSQEVADTFDLKNGKANEVQLALWNPNHGMMNIVRKVDLNPKYCNGHTFRYSATGWSLQQLYFGGLLDNKLYYSTLQGFNEKGAIDKDTINSNRTAHLLNWVQIKSDQRRLKYFIETKLTTRKIGTFLILKSADEELQSGAIKI